MIGTFGCIELESRQAWFIWTPRVSRLPANGRALNPPGATFEEVQLLQRIARHDREAFEQFYDRYADVVYSFAARVLHDPDDAADVTQDVFVQIWEKSGSYRADLGKPISWVITLTRNRAIDRLRKLQRSHEFHAAIAEDFFEVPQHDQGGPPGSRDVNAIRSALSVLPPEQRQAIELAFFSGLTQDEIARSLAQPLGTIKARIRRGMMKLRAALKELL